MGFQCYFGVLVTTKLNSYYKAVSSIELCKISLGSWKVQREWAWFNTPYGDHIQENAPSTLDFFYECLCLHLNLKCIEQNETIFTIRTEKC